jgi:hypothetical protein
MLTHNFYQKYISLEKSPRLGKANNDTFWKYLCLRTIVFRNEIVIYLTSSCVILAKITQKRVEYNVFLFDEPLKGSKSLKIFKISLTFRFDKLSNLSKSVHTGENSQILTVSNKK